MRGIPKSINTKEDVAYLVNLALSDELDREEVKKRLEGLFSDEKVWVFKAEVTDSYVPEDDENIMLGQDMRPTCYKLTDNPNAAYLLMGYSREELTGLINQL